MDGVPSLDLLVELILIKDFRIEHFAIGNLRQGEQARAERPPIVIPLHGRAIGVTPGVGRIIERACINDRPVQEIVAGIVGVAVGIEDIDYRQFAHRHDHGSRTRGLRVMF